MVSIHRRPSWAIAEACATPEDIYFNRRAILTGMGLGGLSAAALAITAGRAHGADAVSDQWAARRFPASLYPAPRNEIYTLDRELTPEEINGAYNNFYEFGSHKSIAAAAQKLAIRPWDMEIDGMVEKPVTVAFDDLVRRIPLEERLYRHRCVEAWSMTVPWTGFALSELVKFAKPLGSARYIRFETFMDPSIASGQKQIWYPWPYVEGVTMAEAVNDLSFMVTGAYGKPAAKQFGAPVRLALPWKYGFKSIKSIKRITFTEDRPKSFWEEIAPTEYGFWANVNPEVPHPRWSQDSERILHTGERVPTLLFNGYGEQVADLYKDLQGESLFM